VLQESAMTRTDEGWLVVAVCSCGRRWRTRTRTGDKRDPYELWKRLEGKARAHCMKGGTS